MCIYIFFLPVLVRKSVLVNIHTTRVRNSHRICLVCVVDFVNGRLIATFINISLTDCIRIYSPHTLQSDFVVLNRFTSWPIAILFGIYFCVRVTPIF